MDADQFSLHPLSEKTVYGLGECSTVSNKFSVTGYPVSGSRFSKRIGAHDAFEPLSFLRCAWKPDAQSAQSSNG
jgi:hypothetical protein